MDFGETDWHSDVKTNRLVTSLFGPSSSSGIFSHGEVSRKKVAQEGLTIKNYNHHHKANNVVNDDDTFVSRKEKNRLKKRRREHDQVKDEDENGGFSSKEFIRKKAVEFQSQRKGFLEESSDISFKKTKQTYSVRDCADDYFQNVSKRRKLKSGFENAQCGLKEIKTGHLNKQSDENQCEKHSSYKDVASENIKKSPNKRKRPCKHNKYKHLSHANSRNSSIVPQIEDFKSFVSNTNKSVNRKPTENISNTDGTDLKHLDKSVDEIIKCRDTQRSSLPFKTKKVVEKERCSLPLNLPGRNERETKNCRMSEKCDGRQTKHKHKANKTVKMSVNTKCVSENTANLSVLQNQHDTHVQEMTADLESGVSTDVSSRRLSVKNRKKELLSKQKKLEQTENVSVDKSIGLRLNAAKHNSVIQEHEVLTNSLRTTARKSNFPFNVEKLKAYLDKNKPQQSEKKSDKKLKHKQHSLSKYSDADLSETPDTNNSTKTFLEKVGKSKKQKSQLSLQEKLRDQLSSARFRYLSEQMYTQTGSEAQSLFVKDKESFRIYHEGYQAQVNKWPLSPLSVIISEIKKGSPDLIVVDFGCGEAILAQTVPNTVHSFDLVALNKHVTACDMSKVPLNNGSVDIAVFCLSLMGTNLTDYLCEASRILKKGGMLKIAEVASRFEKKSKFARNVERMGFQLANKNTENKMFYMFDFVKVTNVKKELHPEIKLNPCLYKKR